MMAQGGTFAYLHGTKFQAARLPYYPAATYGFLPDEDYSFKEFEESLTADNWDRWIPNLENREGYLEMPHAS